MCTDLLELLDHPDRTEQNYTFNQAILESLDSIINKGDQFKIVAFSLKDDKANILKILIMILLMTFL